MQEHTHKRTDTGSRSSTSPTSPWNSH